VSETAQAAAPARELLERILVDPTPDDLWGLQKALLAIDADSEAVARARATARAFHACLRTLDSKSASRRASRWGAVLGTAAVGAVSAGEVDAEQQSALRRLLPAMLEVGAAVKTAEAWEVEAGLAYDDLAWFLYDELWALSSDARPDLPTEARREEMDRLIDPLLDTGVPDADKAALVVSLFRAVLAARVVPLLDPR
jgi:hypothetical protein